MCGRFVITSPPAVVRQVFWYAEQPNFPPRYNIAPTQPIPVVILENGARHFKLMRWGLIPAWVKDPRNLSLLINARRETVLEKPAFKNAIKRRRCLIPADGYYEWNTAGGRRRPYFIHRRDGALFGLAGLAETWIGPNGEELDTVARVHPAALHMAEVEAAATGGQPDLLQGWLGVDDDAAVVGKHQFEHTAGALRVDVDDVDLQPLVGLGFDGRQHGVA